MRAAPHPSSRGRARISTIRIRLQDGRIIPFLVLGFWDKNTMICAGATRDLVLSSFKRHDSACDLMLSVDIHRRPATREVGVPVLTVVNTQDETTDTLFFAVPRSVL